MQKYFLDHFFYLSEIFVSVEMDLSGPWLWRNRNKTNSDLNRPNSNAVASNSSFFLLLKEKYDFCFNSVENSLMNLYEKQKNFLRPRTLYESICLKFVYYVNLNNFHRHQIEYNAYFLTIINPFLFSIMCTYTITKSCTFHF